MMENLPSDLLNVISQYHDDLKTLSHLTSTCTILAHTLNHNAFIWANLSRSVLNRLYLSASSKRHKLKMFTKLSALDAVRDDVHALKKFMREIVMNCRKDQVGKQLSIACKEPASKEKYDRIMNLLRSFDSDEMFNSGITRLFERVPHLLLCDYAENDQIVCEQYVIETLRSLFGQYKLPPYGEGHDCLEDSILTKSIEIVRIVLQHLPQTIRKTEMNYLQTCVTATIPYDIFNLLLEEVSENVCIHIETTAMFLCVLYPDHGYDLLDKYQIDISKVSHTHISNFIKQIPLSDKKKQVLKYFIDQGLILTEPSDVPTRLITWVIHDKYQMNNDEEILHLLLTNGARVFSDDFDNDPLVYAALRASTRHCIRMIPLLIRFGANVHYRYISKDSLINGCVSWRFNSYHGVILDVLPLLLEGGADAATFTLLHGRWRAPLFALTDNGGISKRVRDTAGRMLIDYGADVHAASPSGETFKQYGERSFYPHTAIDFYHTMVRYANNKGQSI